MSMTYLAQDTSCSRKLTQEIGYVQTLAFAWFIATLWGSVFIKKIATKCALTYNYSKSLSILAFSLDWIIYVQGLVFVALLTTSDM